MLVDQNPHIWHTWAEALNRWGVRDLAATFLDALGPLNVFGAQFVYVGQPFLNQFLPEGDLEALAKLLENPQETQAFIRVLQQTDHHSGS